MPHNKPVSNETNTADECTTKCATCKHKAIIGIKKPCVECVHNMAHSGAWDRWEPWKT